MGRKRKSQSIKAKRANAAAAALADEQVDRILSKTVENKSDSDLFVIDTNAASNHDLSFIPKEDRTSKKKKFDKQHVSNEKKVKSLIERYGEDGVGKLAEEGALMQKKKRRRMRRVAGTARANFDLWGDDNDDAATSKDKKGKVVPKVTGQSAAAGTAPITLTSDPTTKEDVVEVEHKHDKDAIHPSAVQTSNKLIKNRKMTKSLSKPTVSIELAHGGQSYNPDVNQHQDVIGEALSIELKREEALAYRNVPISNGLSKKTLAIMVHSSDEDNSSDDDDNSDEEAKEEFHPRRKNASSNPAINRENKKTRSQRNKQKRLRAEQALLEKRKSEKSFNHELNQIKQHSKEIQKKEREQKERLEYLKEVKEEKQKEPLGVGVLSKLSNVDPICVPSLPVALTSELGGGGAGDDGAATTTSLRKVKPKGSLLTDRSESMVSRKMVHRKTLQRKTVVQGKKRKMKGGKGREYLLV